MGGAGLWSRISSEGAECDRSWRRIHGRTAISGKRCCGFFSLFRIPSADDQARGPTLGKKLRRRKEVTIVGSFVGRNKFPRSIAVLESGVVDLWTYFSRGRG